MQNSFHLNTSYLKHPALIWLPSARTWEQPDCRKWYVTCSQEESFVKVASCNLSVWYLSTEEEEWGLLLRHKPPHVVWFLNRTPAGAKPSCVNYTFGPVTLPALRPAARQETWLSECQRRALACPPTSSGYPEGAAVPVGMSAQRITSTGWLEKNSCSSKCMCQSCLF